MPDEPLDTVSDTEHIAITYERILDAADDPALFNRMILQLSRPTTTTTTDESNEPLTFTEGDLGLLYQTRYERQGKPADLDLSIHHFTSALASLPPGHPYTSGYQQSLAKSYADRYQATNALNDLDAALKYDQASVDSTMDPEDPDLPARYRNLAASYRDRFHRLGDLADSDSCLYYGQAALDATPPGDPELPARQQSLAAAYTDRYQREGDVSLLHTAMRLYEAAVNGSSTSDWDYPTRLQALSIGYKDLYQAYEDVSDLEVALKLDLAAIKAAPAGYPSLGLMKDNLAVTYGMRYLRFGDKDDLAAALANSREAVELTGAGDVLLPVRQETLGLLYQHVFLKHRDVHDLESAAHYHEAALQATPTGHPRLAERQFNLAHSLYERYRLDGNMDDLETALEMSLKAAENTPPGDAQISRRFHNVAVIYRFRYGVVHNLADLYSALSYHYKSLHAIDDKHVNWPIRQYELGTTYAKLFDCTRDPSDLACALYYCKQATTSSFVIPPTMLWKAANIWAAISHKQNLPECITAYSMAFSVLPDVIWVGNSMDVRHDLLVQHDISNIFASAVAAAIKFGKLNLAVEFLEGGLAISYKQILQLRDEAAELRDAYPELAEELKELSLRLWQATTLGSASSIGEQSSGMNSQSHHDVGLERKRLIESVRNLPGFEDFFLPLTYSKLSSASTEGPVIMINGSSSQFDALILLGPSTPIQHVTFSAEFVTLKSANSQLDKLRLALEMCNITSRDPDSEETSRYGVRFDKSAERATQLFREVLAWLSKYVVQPVVSVLEDNGIAGRIWWCPSGPFTYLPLHAAAAQSPFIQSYTSTLNTLIQGRLKHSQQRTIQKDVLFTAIGVSQLPGQPQLALPSVNQELQKISAIFKNHQTTQLRDEEATVQAVFEHIQRARWVHLACHGQQNPFSPLESGLLLHDGKLQLGQILETSLPSAEFIFLSACQTAMGDAKLPNESMHLAGGFIAAGFQGGIGTLWNMADSDGPRVTEIVYREIFGREGDQDPDCGRAAGALHRAVQRLREGGAPFQRWIPFIHIGI